MITIKELGLTDEIPAEHMKNLINLHFRINLFRTAYGKPLRVSSGYRSMEKHLAIYAAKGITDPKKIPMKSNHLFGLAADVVPVEDDIEHLQDWVLSNKKLTQGMGLYFEAFSATPSWCHIQLVAPKSGVWMFLP